jgi:hypothetical protein
MKNYSDFEIWIGAPIRRAVFPVQVFSSPAGPATGVLKLDIGAPDFANELSLARAEGPDLAARRAFGRWLFRTLLHDDIGRAWATSLGRITDGLRLRLWINDAGLSALPWELLCDESSNFLATAANLAVSRYLPVPEPPPVTVRKPLKMLLIVESPPELPAIDEEEVAGLVAALDAHGQDIKLTQMRDPTILEIQTALQDDYHVVHFLGHGFAGKLAVKPAGGHPARSVETVEDEAFAQLFQGRPNTRLVVLSACHSSQSDERGLFGGVGPALIRKGVSAVVAMQYPAVSIETAGLFSERFYGCLAKMLPVDFAVNEARQALSAGPLLSQRDWSTPILYMGTRNGRILSLISPDAGETERAWFTVSAAAQSTQGAQESLKEVAERFRQIAEQQRSLAELLVLADHLRKLRADFAACSAIVEQAGGATALGPKLARLKQAWVAVRGGEWASFQVILHDRPNLNNAGTAQLEAGAQDIETRLQRLQLSELYAALIDWGMQLDLALAAAEESVGRAMQELQGLTDITLSRFTID